MDTTWEVHGPLSPRLPHAIGSGAERRGGKGLGMIHLECGSGWCTAQGTPDQDCGDAGSPAEGPARPALDPRGLARPLLHPASGQGAAGRDAPQRPATPSPSSWEMAEACVG